MAIVEVKDLVKRYGTIESVREMSFEVEAGELFGLLGPNGAGKSTTMAMLSGLLPPSGGTAIVCGIDIRRSAHLVKHHIGLVPQDLALYPTLSARDNLLFFGRIYGLTGRQLRSRVAWALELADLSARAGDPVHTFSGGMKRRLNISASLLHRPEVLFLDEPTVGVDPQSRNHIFESIEQLNREGMTVIYTTHYMEEAERLCQRVAIVDGGKVIALDSPERLIALLGARVVRIGLTAEHARAMLARAQHHPCIEAARQVPEGLEMKSHRLEETLTCLLDGAREQQVPIQSLQILEQNLETVFLHLTGKQLRE